MGIVVPLEAPEMVKLMDLSLAKSMDVGDKPRRSITQVFAKKRLRAEGKRVSYR